MWLLDVSDEKEFLENTADGSPSESEADAEESLL